MKFQKGIAYIPHLKWLIHTKNTHISIIHFDWLIRSEYLKLTLQSLLSEK